jgi:pimeloyl-ACP methyl ester carboxylesterase
VLLIFGEYAADRAQAEAQYAAAQEPKEMWIVPGAGHGGYSQADPAEYQQRVLEFLETQRGTQP